MAGHLSLVEILNPLEAISELGIVKGHFRTLGRERLQRFACLLQSTVC